MWVEPPLDECQPILKKKIKPVCCLRKGITKSILRAKREKKKGKPMRTLASRQVQERRTIIQSSSNDMEDTSSNEDAKWGTRGDSSGAEVEGENDYKP